MCVYKYVKFVCEGWWVKRQKRVWESAVSLKAVLQHTHTHTHTHTHSNFRNVSYFPFSSRLCFLVPLFTPLLLSDGKKKRKEKSAAGDSRPEKQRKGVWLERPDRRWDPADHLSIKHRGFLFSISVVLIRARRCRTLTRWFNSRWNGCPLLFEHTQETSLCADDMMLFSWMKKRSLPFAAKSSSRNLRPPKCLWNSSNISFRNQSDVWWHLNVTGCKHAWWCVKLANHHVVCLSVCCTRWRCKWGLTPLWTLEYTYRLIDWLIVLFDNQDKNSSDLRLLHDVLRRLVLHKIFSLLSSRGK